MSAPSAAAPCQASPTDPSADRDALALPNLTVVLRLVQILLTYGRHLADTFDRRSTSAGFHLIARLFGTSNTAVILAHIRRGILRAAALHHVLLKRAASGRDLVRPSRQVGQKPQSEQSDTDQAIPSELAPASAPRKRKSHPRPAWRDDWLDGVADPLDPCHLPKFEDLLKEVSRDPLGRSLGKICADLGIGPRLCQSQFWTDLFITMARYDGSPGTYDVHRWRREQHFEEEQDRHPTMDLTWPPVDFTSGRTDIIRVMGFFIGEPPVEPALILPPEPPSWVRRPSAASAPPETPEAPQATGPP